MWVIAAPEINIIILFVKYKSIKNMLFCAIPGNKCLWRPVLGITIAMFTILSLQLHLTGFIKRNNRHHIDTHI